MQGDQMNGDVVVMNGDDSTDGTQKHVTIDGPSLITDKMSVFMVRCVDLLFQSMLFSKRGN